MVGLSVDAELSLLRGELFLHAFQLIVLILEFGLLGLEFLAQGFHVAAAFVRSQDRTIDVDRAHFRSGIRSGGGRGWICR